MNTSQSLKEQEMHFSELPFYLTVKKVIEGETVSIKVESKVHVNRVVLLPTRYSTEYVQDRPNQFRREVLSAIVKRYGLTLESPRYV